LLLMYVIRWGISAAFLIALASASACGGSSADEAGVEPEWAVENAGARVGFDLRVPTRLPPGLAEEPEVIVTGVKEVTLRYLPRHSPVHSEDLFLEIIETSEQIEPWESNLSSTRRSVLGTDVALEEVNGTDSAYISALFTHEGLTFWMSLHWDRQSDWDGSAVQSEVLSVVTSLIETDG
jgi:hypothetical protein